MAPACKSWEPGWWVTPSWCSGPSTVLGVMLTSEAMRLSPAGTGEHAALGGTTCTDKHSLVSSDAVFNHIDVSLVHGNMS